MALRQCAACARDSMRRWRMTLPLTVASAARSRWPQSTPAPGLAAPAGGSRSYYPLSATIITALGKPAAPPPSHAPAKGSLGALQPKRRRKRRQKASQAAQEGPNTENESKSAASKEHAPPRRLRAKQVNKRNRAALRAAQRARPASTDRFEAPPLQPAAATSKDSGKDAEREEAPFTEASRPASSSPPAWKDKLKTQFFSGEKAQMLRTTVNPLAKEDEQTYRKTGRLQPAETIIEKVEPLRPMQPPTLAHGLDRVLFNPGVYWLKDPRSSIYNFDPRLRDVLDVDLFDYDTLPPYVTSSEDPELAELARRHSTKFRGSTSSLTGLLSQCYFALSGWRDPDLSGFSAGFDEMMGGFSMGAMLPASVKLVHKDGRYAIDSDKSASGEAENSNYVLTNLGKAMEKMLTTTPEDFQRFTRLHSSKVSEEERNAKESYHYAKTDNFLMRSQLDCQDSRLPRKTFDLKTRAVVAVRQDRANWVESSGYQIRHATGLLESFEREYYDMIRAALLKYNFQARIGHMDGIFVCYHNTATVFGFQYLSVEEMNLRLFGSQQMADLSYRMSIELLEKILEACTKLYPDESLKLTVNALKDGSMDVFVEPYAAAAPSEGAASGDGDRISLIKVDMDRWLKGRLVEGQIRFEALGGQSGNLSHSLNPDDKSKTCGVDWIVDYSIEQAPLPPSRVRSQLERVRSRQLSITSLIQPNVDAINERERYRETVLAANPEALRRFLEDRRSGKAAGMPEAPGQVTGPVTPAAQAIAAELDDAPSSSDDGSSDADAAAADSEKSSTAPKLSARDVYWEKIRGERIRELRKLAQVGAQDAASAAKKDPLRMYGE